jgi:internalin A
VSGQTETVRIVGRPWRQETLLVNALSSGRWPSSGNPWRGMLIKMRAKPSSKPLWYLPRVSVRALMTLVLVVGGGIGWTVTTARSARIQRAAVADVESAGGYVFYDCDRDPKRVVHVRMQAYHKYRPRAQNMPELKPPPRFGIDYCHNVVEIVLYGILEDDELVRIGRFPRVEKVWHAGSSHWVSDAGLAHLHGLARLRELDLSNSSITDAGLVHLKGMTSLRQLNLSRTRITDAGLVHVRGLTSLERLGLRGTDVGTAGVVYLKELTNLRLLDLCGTDVDELTAQELRRSLPYSSILVKPIWEM